MTAIFSSGKLPQADAWSRPFSEGQRCEVLPLPPFTPETGPRQSSASPRDFAGTNTVSTGALAQLRHHRRSSLEPKPQAMEDAGGSSILQECCSGRSRNQGGVPTQPPLTYCFVTYLQRPKVPVPQTLSVGCEVSAGAPRRGDARVGVAQRPWGQRLGPHQLRRVGEKGDVCAAGRCAGGYPGGVRLLHGGRQVCPIPPIILVLILVQEVASPCWVFKKWLLIFQAIAHSLGSWGGAVESKRVPRGFLEKAGKQCSDSGSCRPSLPDVCCWHRDTVAHPGGPEPRSCGSALPPISRGSGRDVLRGVSTMAANAASGSPLSKPCCRSPLSTGPGSWSSRTL